MGLSERLPCEIVSVDSMAVYRGMDIGTAKPTVAQRHRVCHHLIDICEPSHNYSAAEFCHDAQQSLRRIFKRGNIPVLVGGTMFYFHVLQHGLSPVPPTDTQLRDKIRRRFEVGGSAALHRWLRWLDPVGAEGIHPHDRQRLQRAIEICTLSGQPLAARPPRQKPHLSWGRVYRFSVTCENRTVLHRRIERRFDEMLRQGLADELANLLAQGRVYPQCNALRGVGYRQMWEYLSGGIDYEAMRRRAIAAGRQLAKRQLTWLRRMDTRVFNSDRLSDRMIITEIEKMLAKE